MKEGEGIFEPLQLRRRELVPVGPNQYRITALSGKTVQIEALTAYGALIQSGFKMAVKIERISNLNRNLIGKAEFADDAVFNASEAFADVTQQDHDSPEAILLHRNPILTAEQLDILMKTLEQKDSVPQEPVAEPSPEAVPQPDTQEAAAIVQDGPPVVRAPMPTGPAVFEAGREPGPMGLDVHGDGFDEIIPSSNPAKPNVPLRHAEPGVTAGVTETTEPLPPARELTEAEVEKLLGGK